MAVEAQTPAPAAAAPARPRPKREREEEVLVWPDLVFIEFISAVLFTITFLLLSVFINAPLLNRANLNVTPNPSKAPWYFLNLQELLLHMDKAWAGVLVPTIALAFFAIIPYIDRSREGQGVWFGTRYSVRLTVITAIYAIIVSFGLVAIDAGDTRLTPGVDFRTEMLTRWVPACPEQQADVSWPCLRDEPGAPHKGFVSTKDVSKRLEFSVFGLDWPGDLDHIAWPFNDSIGDWDLGAIGLSNIHGWGGEHLNIPAAMAEQVIPLSTIAFLAVFIIYVLFRLGWVRTRRDVFIVMFTGVMFSYLALSLIGSFFRGPGQDLIGPWDIKVDEG
jgi:quinol-cytochrome oxidoreductase complex cytochrome b subunit